MCFTPWTTSLCLWGSGELESSGGGNRRVVLPALNVPITDTSGQVVDRVPPAQPGSSGQAVHKAGHRAAAREHAFATALPSPTPQALPRNREVWDSPFGWHASISRRSIQDWIRKGCIKSVLPDLFLKEVHKELLPDHGSTYAVELQQRTTELDKFMDDRPMNNY